MADHLAMWRNIKTNYADQTLYDDNKGMTKAEIKCTPKANNKTVTIENDASYADNRLIPESKISYTIQPLSMVGLTRIYSCTGSSSLGNYREFESVNLTNPNTNWGIDEGGNGMVYIQGYGVSSQLSSYKCYIDGVQKYATANKPGGGTATLNAFYVTWGQPLSGTHNVIFTNTITGESQQYIISVYPTLSGTEARCEIKIQNPSIITKDGGILRLRDNIGGKITDLWMINTMNVYYTISMDATITEWYDKSANGISNSFRNVELISGSLTTTKDGKIQIKLN